MKVVPQSHAGVTVLTAHGPLIAEETVDLRRALENATAAKARRIVLDLADVPYLDSTGIELLLEIGGSGRPLCFQRLK